VLVATVMIAGCGALTPRNAVPTACGGCSDVPPASTPPPSTANTSDPIEDTARTDQFQLSLVADHHAYHVGDAVKAVATLRYVGSAQDVLVTGSGSGPLQFTVTDMATGRTTGGLMTADCGTRHFHPGDTLTIPFVVSGGIEEWRAVGVEAPGPLTLIAGTWRLTVKPAFGIGPDCPTFGSLAASVTVTVSP
jgi:hypothetical protein